MWCLAVRAEEGGVCGCGFSFLLCHNPRGVLQYGLKKKEVHVEEEPDPMSEGRVGRKKKTPAELAAENNPDSDDDEFASKFSSLCCCMNFV